MNVEQCIKNANEAHASGNTDEAMQWLKQAGEFGDVNAALDYAYFRSRENPRKSLAFLEGVKCADNPVVQFHKLQIGYYGDVITNTKLVAKTLIALGNEGVIEAYLVALSYLPVNSTTFSYIASRVCHLAPNISKQLNLHSASQVTNDESLNQEVIEEISESLGRVYEPSKVLDTSLPINVYESLLSEYECHYLITKFSSLLQPSMIVDPRTGEGIIDSVRTSYVAVIEPSHCDWITRKLDKVISQITNTPRRNGEALNLLRYEPGQQYKPHYDGLNEINDGLMFKDGKQRTKTALVYLNTVDEGGETLFPKLNIRIVPRCGTVVVFSNSDKDGKLLLNSYHSGAPSISQNKWIVTKWIRECTTIYGNVVYGTYTKG
ncbi:MULTISPECIES: prolyl hydroxylase family protein [Alteromonas]|jgi:prolyl 4-hydroxylase|uniref:prolyl hydroxylase family protein n=1 Tax=Alteromonas TaxID=226 RepID=UPI0012735DE6|nr:MULTISPECIES: 2OG-Fe(II) oxygenase [Alteromonas]MCH2058565.1 2OG-Fe(II) oxygenase [Thalassotalea sp.]CAI2389234.1 prolyl 4-hydroxylase [Alteromonas macleodii]CAI3941208.1 prolyl 4-hydroxylase [Alteromonas macleodii]CAI3942212.1 prolyl 4-hydroxylase [Alteromonas macleodii]CAI3942287.1 prolyl 4-hydroxylase [Alteromonas macleodii]|tara:strand:+ start:164 stop:1294 length:1131 start_codon:yes stop_codon:yes gene_type:complete